MAVSQEEPHSSPVAEEVSAGPFLVFISHSGKEKRSFVAFLKDAFDTALPDVPVFLDEDSLRPAGPAMHNIEVAMNGAPVGESPERTQMVLLCIAAHRSLPLHPTCVPALRSKALNDPQPAATRSSSNSSTRALEFTCSHNGCS
jgi:hypothetical protein